MPAHPHGTSPAQQETSRRTVRSFLQSFVRGIRKISRGRPRAAHGLSKSPIALQRRSCRHPSGERQALHSQLGYETPRSSDTLMPHTSDDPLHAQFEQHLWSEAQRLWKDEEGECLNDIVATLKKQGPLPAKEVYHVSLERGVTIKAMDRDACPGSERQEMENGKARERVKLSGAPGAPDTPATAVG